MCQCCVIFRYNRNTNNVANREIEGGAGFGEWCRKRWLEGGRGGGEGGSVGS